MDMDYLVDTVTRMILDRLGGDQPVKVVTFGDIPPELICDCAEKKQGETCADIEGCDYIVMSIESFRRFHSGEAAAPSAPAQSGGCEPAGCKSIDLSGKRLIHERDLRDHDARGGDIVKVSKNAIITALAHDYAKGIGAKIVKE